MYSKNCWCGAEIQAKTEDQIDTAMKAHDDETHGGKEKKGKGRKKDDDD
jgi:hypothetical protein